MPVMKKLALEATIMKREANIVTVIFKKVKKVFIKILRW